MYVCMYRRESWPGYSTYTIWQTLLGTSRKLGRDHAVLADLYSTQMSNRIVEMTEDLQRIYKKVSITVAPPRDAAASNRSEGSDNWSRLNSSRGKRIRPCNEKCCEVLCPWKEPGTALR